MGFIQSQHDCRNKHKLEDNPRYRIQKCAGHKCGHSETICTKPQEKAHGNTPHRTASEHSGDQTAIKHFDTLPCRSCIEKSGYDYIIIKDKGNKERVVPKSPLLSKWLIKYLAVRKGYFAYRATPENIFLSKNAKPLTNSMVDRIIKDAGKSCGISADVRISAHTFRHTYAQLQLKYGLDIYSLSRLLGHENISITQTYLNGIRDSEVLKQAEHTSPLMNM